jgi:hypothetical protein
MRCQLRPTREDVIARNGGACKVHDDAGRPEARALSRDRTWASGRARSRFRGAGRGTRMGARERTLGVLRTSFLLGFPGAVPGGWPS